MRLVQHGESRRATAVGQRYPVLANHLRGNSGANVLNGSGGNDVLQGGAGNDTITDTSGRAVLDGGDGTDALTGGTDREFFAGGTGADTFTLGGGADITAFNRGHGADVVNAPTTGAGLGEANDTLSLAGIRYSELRLARSGSDLLVKVAGTTDSIRFANWYGAAGNKTTTSLQMIVDSTADYNAASTDPLLNRRVVRLNFTSLVAAFDTAYAANSAIGDWAVPTATLSAARTASSDTDAIGGQLAYRHGRDGNLTGLDFATAQVVLSDANFATAAQLTGSGGTTGGARLMSVQGAASESTNAVIAGPMPKAGSNRTTATQDDETNMGEHIRIAPPLRRFVETLTGVWKRRPSAMSSASLDGGADRVHAGPVQRVVFPAESSGAGTHLRDRSPASAEATQQDVVAICEDLGMEAKASGTEVQARIAPRERVLAADFPEQVTAAPSARFIAPMGDRLKLGGNDALVQSGDRVSTMPVDRIVAQDGLPDAPIAAGRMWFKVQPRVPLLTPQRLEGALAFHQDAGVPMRFGTDRIHGGPEATSTTYTAARDWLQHQRVSPFDRWIAVAEQSERPMPALGGESLEASTGAASLGGTPTVGIRDPRRRISAAAVL